MSALALHPPRRRRGQPIASVWGLGICLVSISIESLEDDVLHFSYSAAMLGEVMRMGFLTVILTVILTQSLQKAPYESSTFSTLHAAVSVAPALLRLLDVVRLPGMPGSVLLLIIAISTYSCSKLP
eukprot:TRINITY_DN18402_c0_g3_i4.p1 TRINITY_DN18402_c0_g3~~TRINITY_DN18402_c0_g3_i4.p1  ORF type:complete len:144 (-),score=1.26 TRINITY_DN18402_c0_g3_i4:41-418(-)